VGGNRDIRPGLDSRVEGPPRLAPPGGGGAAGFLETRGSLSVLPFAIVAYFLATTASLYPLAVQLGGALLLVASVAVSLGPRWERLSLLLVAMLLAVETILAVARSLWWPQSSGWIILIWAAGTAGARLPGRAALIGVIILGAICLTMSTAPVAGPPQIGGSVVWIALLFGSIFVIGTQRRAQREYLLRMEALVVSLQAYSEQLEEAHRLLQAEALQAAALAAAEERNRIAREIHDVLAHSLTVIVVQAQAIKRLVRADPDAAELQADTVATLAREGLQEARRSVSALRASSGDLDGLGRLRGLVEEFGRNTGTATGFTVQGAAGDLSPSAWATLYRVTQEALTNARRHGQAQKVDVRLAVDGAARLTIDDDGAASPAVPITAGNGLIGMRERAERLGGRLAHGPRANGGFHVELELPA
jgi:signal transduction histidine kinase